ncbi:MAG: MBL fold metallo-hydrolase, partial [Anaerolineaceae bacterium]|nr:MBL fold metallo-hydrolase [Anaerolineaceae bacterium]
ASSNVNRLIRVAGVPDAENLHISIGDEIIVGNFKITVLKGTHGVTPLDFLLNRPVPQNLRYPLRLTDYRLDGCCAFLFEWEGLTFLIGESPVRADLAFVYPLRDPKQYLWYLPQVAPQVVVPIHWDDFFQPLNHTIRTLPYPKLGFPPKIRRIDIEQFCSGLRAEMGEVKTIIPTPFQWMAAGHEDGVLTIN